MSSSAAARDCRPLSALRNVGKATLADFQLLGIATVGDLATRDADELYLALERITGGRQDPCVHDVFAPTIHEASTGEAKNWWAFTPARKARQAAGSFPARQAPVASD
jgi:nucleotidyltransferase/DNA polymerase involved in DNA repair